MTDDMDRLIREADTASLKRGYNRNVRLARIYGIAAILCVLAGIWIDVRWLVTALIPLVLCACAGHGIQRSVHETARRLDANRESA